MRYEEFEDTKG